MAWAVPRYPAASAPALALACLAYPWLHARAPGPSPATEPLLVALASVALLMALAAAHGSATLPRALLAILLAGAGAVWLRDLAAQGAVPPSPSIVAAWIALAAIAACAALGALSASGERAGPWPASLLAWGWVIAALLSTVVALAQYFGLAHELGALAAYSDARQAYGNLRQRNLYASLVSIGLLSLGWLALYGKPAPPRWFVLAAAGLLCAGTAVAASRTGAVQLAALLALAAWWLRGTGARKIGLLIPLGCYLAAALAMLYAGDSGSGAAGVLRRLAGDAPDCHGRRMLWANTLTLIGERPLLGWGWRELPYAFYAGEFAQRFCAIVENAHNLPLHLAVELGLPVALAFGALCLWGVAKGRPWAETDPARRLAWGVLLLIALHSMVEYPLWYGPFQMALGLCLGLLLGPRPSVRLSRRVLVSWALALAGVTGYVAMDYHRVSQLYLPAHARAGGDRNGTLSLDRTSWLFRSQVEFAELAISPLGQENAARLFLLSGRLLHFSPEPRVAERRIESALLLGLADEAKAEAQRYRSAFPAEYAAWVQRAAPTAPLK